MKLCTFQEFAALPPGTIFSYWEPCISRGLFVKGESWAYGDLPGDYWERSLLPGPTIGNSDAPILEDFETRWGIYKYSQMYAVYEAADLMVLRDTADTGLAVMDVCEHGIQTGEWCAACRQEYKTAR